MRRLLFAANALAFWLAFAGLEALCCGPAFATISTAFSKRSHASGSSSILPSVGVLLPMRSITDLPKEDAELFTRIGHFLFWYSAVELCITDLLVRCLGYDNDRPRIEILIYGMDSRTKCERLKKAGKIGMPLGPNLLSRVTHFQEKYIPLRNKFSHRVPHGMVDRIAFSQTVFAQPSEANKEEILYADLFEKTEWLNWLAHDLVRASSPTNRTGTLEIVHPRSKEPKEADLPTSHRGLSASARKRGKKPPSSLSLAGD